MQASVDYNFDPNHPKMYVKAQENVDLVIKGTKGETLFSVIGKVSIDVYLGKKTLPSYNIDGW